MNWTLIAEVAGGAAEAAKELPLWVTALITVLVLAAGYVLKPIISGEKKKHEAVIANEKSTAKEKLEARLKLFLLERAEVAVEDKAGMLAIARGIQTKELTTLMGIKKRLYAMGAGLKQEAQDYFSAQDVDLLVELGEPYLDKAIAYAANKVSPFPGKDTAIALLGGGADRLLAKGAAALKREVDPG